MWNFLGGSNLTMWVANIEKPAETLFPERPTFALLMVIHDILKPTIVFRAGFWLLACLLMLVLAWRRRDTPEGAFTIAVCGSASLYVLTFFAVGVASDFRYGYWAVLASLAGLPALLVRVRPQPG
jgi:peptidoglycan/LPS O-acetylase OafA/YrhL